ncbi:exodeoxyribonuclease V subunit gamma [Leuconostocaceae bacterium ESL0723]|nr:exodeoxyribonuclease V subunit gamma [Leuconostocaceae bacterium ESL0723]
MTLEIIMDRGQADFRADMLAKIKTDLAENPQLSVYYLVPNHIKFDSEVDVLQRFATLNGFQPDQVYAQSRLQVYSLSRLAWTLLNGAGLQQPPVLQTAGLYMLVSQILNERAAQLPVFARMQNKKGFVATLVAQLLELRASQVSPADLLSILDQTDVSDQDYQWYLKQGLDQKLRDLSVVSEAFNQALGDQWLTSQDVLADFASKISHLNLENVAFYIDGFNGFTNAEWGIIQQLVAHYPVTVGLLGQVDRLGQQEEGDVFERPMTTAQRLIATAKQAQIPYEIQAAKHQRPLSDSLAASLSAWAHLGQYQSLPLVQQPDQLSAFVAENSVTELEEVARRIRRSLAADPSLRLKDILIVARDLDPYTTQIPTVMDQFDLPYFLDNDLKMANHPIVELVTNLLKPKNQLFYHQNLLAILKTGYVRPHQGPEAVAEDEYFEAVDYLENYVLGHQPSAQRWLDYRQPFALYELDRNDDETDLSSDAVVNRRINIIRQFIGSALQDFEQQLSQADTMQAAATALMDWLNQYRVPEMMMAQRDRWAEQGDLQRAQQVGEVWQLFVQSLDQMVAISGDQPYDLNHFRDSLLAGFAGANFTGIPNQLDQLTISEAGIVQSQNYRQLYFIGGSRQNLPAQVKTRAMINDAERLLVQPALAEQDQPRYLQDTAQQQMATENLLFYGALMATTEAVTLSYPLINAAGELNEISPYYQRLLYHFQTRPTPVPARPKDSQDLLDHYVGTDAATVSQLLKLPSNQDHQPSFRTLVKLLRAQNQGERLERVFAGRDYQNRVVPVKKELTQQLFRLPLNVSISQLESYYRNPLDYFLRYGLRLQERPRYEINSAQTGTIYHAVLEDVIGQLIANQQNLRDLSDADLAQLVQRSLTGVLQSPEFDLLTESGQPQAISAYLAQVSDQLFTQMRQAAMTNQSAPAQVEALFGFPQGKLTGLKFKDQGNQVLVRGKLDRLDRQDPAGQYGTIIDYKTNGKEFDWGQAYDGLQMQLLTYWQAAQKNHGNLSMGQISGAFFAPIQGKVRPIKDFKGDLNAMLAGQTDPAQFKYRGLFLAEDAYLDNLAQVDPGQSATHYQLQRKADGSLASRSDGVAPADLERLLDRNQENIIQASRQVAAGHFPLNPVQSSLQYSPYRDILRFDRALGDQYRPVTKNNKAAIIKRLKEEQE